MDALFAPFYNFRGRVRNFFVIQQPILTLEPASGQLLTGLNLFQK